MAEKLMCIEIPGRPATILDARFWTRLAEVERVESHGFTYRRWFAHVFLRVDGHYAVAVGRDSTAKGENDQRRGELLEPGATREEIVIAIECAVAAAGCPAWLARECIEHLPAELT